MSGGETGGAVGEVLLTTEEHAAMDLTADLYHALCRIVGDGQSRHYDMAEIVASIHAIQHTIMAQAACRAYPDRYRLLGETLPATPPEGASL